MENKNTKSPKPPLSDFFKNGDNFQFKRVDYSSPASTAEAIEIREHREKVDLSNFRLSPPLEEID